LADGKRWELLRTEGWEEFSERLASLIVRLPARRRQAVVMLLFALSERMITPDEANAWRGQRLERPTPGSRTTISITTKASRR
jgi:hypothetical protein